MEIFKQMESYGHEQLVFGRDEKTGLRCIVAVHDTTLGPAVGGTRFFNYASEADALYDVLRLSRGMSFKNAAGGLALGGGKAVILGDPKQLKNKEFLHAYARIINSLGGKYYTAEDVNISAADIDCMNEITPYVVGTSANSGNPAPFTADGVYQGIKAGAKIKFGSESLKDKTFVVQGIGSVGYLLCKLLHEEGAKLKVYDIDQEAMNKAVTEFGAEPLQPQDVFTAECDVFSPCAMGAVLNNDNVKGLRCQIICGAANNVLVDASVGEALQKLDILYLPDYIVNAGGVINCGSELTDKPFSVERINQKVAGIYGTTLKIIELAKEKNITTYAAADEYALGIIKAGK